MTRVDTYMTRGDSKDLTFVISESDGRLVDLTGASVTMHVRIGDDVIEKTGVVPPQVVSTGQVKVSIDPADTDSLVLPEGLTPGSRATYRWILPYDLEVTMSGNVRTPIGGVLVVAQDVRADPEPEPDPEP